MRWGAAGLRDNTTVTSPQAAPDRRRPQHQHLALTRCFKPTGFPTSGLSRAPDRHTVTDILLEIFKPQFISISAIKIVISIFTLVKVQLKADGSPMKYRAVLQRPEENESDIESAEENSDA
ncbi:hypothetical protein EYF80_067417 [Liparis tanakae]|uniref:Uncharacterized protein n=1 Tax=Liparis tanakae TaxID=230148 RepID=A0A4Z2E155_9TELE|nr:hypothetical protein EYF80_067417 [Liparis tanakae]